MAAHNLSTEELLALLRDASLKPESIAEEMECAGTTACAPEELERARTLLEPVGKPEGDPAAGEAKELAAGIAALPELLALAVLRAAGEAGRQDLLREVAVGPQKPLAKEAKRELQRLKQKGVKVQELAPRGAPVLRPVPESELPSCFATSIDSYGERAVWFTRPSRVGVEMVQAVISDLKGIVAVDALPLSRKSFRDFVKRMPRGGVVSTVEVPREHARALIAQAAEEGARNGFTPPRSYGEALTVLGSAPAEPPPAPGAAIDLGPDGELPHQMAGAALFSDPLFLAWIPEEEPLRAFAAKVEGIAQSQLYVDDAQRREALDRAADEAAEAYFTLARKTRYARRLVEMAWVLQGDKRIDAARTSLAVSRALAGQGGSSQAFCRALFTHALESARKLGEPEQPAARAPDPAPQGSLILP